jgi:hypothetical protein
LECRLHDSIESTRWRLSHCQVKGKAANAEENKSTKKFVGGAKRPAGMIVWIHD